MANFKDMAERARRAAEERNASRNQQLDDERIERNRVAEAAVNILKMNVIPLLEAAKAEFATTGVESRIVTDFAGREPSVLFQCLGPERRSDKWRFEAPGAFFASDGEYIKIGLGDKGVDRGPSKGSIASVLPMNAEEGITGAIEKALEAYYKALDEHRHNLTR
jgi:hypothetical protein